MKRTSIIILMTAVILAAAGCGLNDASETEIIGGADGPTAIFISNEVGKGSVADDPDGPITEEQALSAIKNYCHINNPDLSDIEKEGEYTVYWEIESEDDDENRSHLQILHGSAHPILY